MLRINLFDSLFNTYLIKRKKHRQAITKLFPIPNFQAKQPDVGPISLKWMKKMKLVHQEFSGCYYLLPNLQRSLEKLIKLIDYEMSLIGAFKISMPCLSHDQSWKLSGRWDTIGKEMFQFQDRHNASLCLSPTHEEAATLLVAAESPISYRRLPLRIYQIGRKFRDELRPKNGLLRCKEFEMKDLYTFDENQENALLTFNEVCTAYSNLLNALKIPFISVEASTGVMGGNMSKEFHILSPSGEDTISLCQKCDVTINKELLNSKHDNNFCKNKSACSLNEKNGIEVAHAFVLGKKYSEIFGATFINQHQQKEILHMGCYGVGVTRLLAGIVEANATEDHFIWPLLLAPHLAVIISQKEGYKSDTTTNLAEKVYDELTSIKELRTEILIDDRLQLSIGQRIKDACMSAIPYIIVVGKKALEDPILYEVIETKNSNKQHLELSALIKLFTTMKIISLS